MEPIRAAARAAIAPRVSLQRSIASWLRRALTREQKEWLRSLLIDREFYPGSSKVEKLRRKLLVMGFVDRAHAELADLAEIGSSRQRRLAARELALFHLNDRTDEPDLEKALFYLEIARSGERNPMERRRLSVLEAEGRARRGDAGGARKILERAMGRGKDADLLLGLANLETDLEARIERVNAALALSRLEPVRLSDRAGASPYDQLTTDPIPPVQDEGPKVSVIMPAYKAERTIATALESIVAQSWRNVEVLVVDDCSPDGTAQVARRIAERDARVRLITSPFNAGTYVARNRGLQQATGEFATCHDADDWSHPRKIELQMRDLLAHPGKVANMSLQARTDGQLVFSRRGNSGYYCFANISSLMFRRKAVLEAVGYWDSVRFMADGEFIRRLQRHFGQEIATVPALASFQRHLDTSLTSDRRFGFAGHLTGARREYFDASNLYHNSGRSLRYDFPMEQRPFPVPEPMRPVREESPRHFDVVIASDFRLSGGSTLSSIEEVEAQAAAGLRTGLIHLARYDVDAHRGLNPKVRQLLHDGKAELVVSGEHIRCDLLIARYPPILHEFQATCPRVEARQAMVVVNQPPMSDYGPSGVVRYSIPRCVDNFVRHFHVPARWWPIGPAIREALFTHHAADLGAVELSDRDWFNIVDVNAWRRGPRPDWKGRPPRIGRHARDNAVKWPADKATLLSVYPDTPDYEVMILGGAEVPRGMLGWLPANWRVFEFDAIHPREYLSQLDVFLYYTHSDWVESFGRTVIEAIAAGVPVVVPPSYQPLLHDAALYAEPQDALKAVDRLMNDPVLYERQVATASRLVRETFGHEMHVRRLTETFGLRVNGKRADPVGRAVAPSAQASRA